MINIALLLREKLKKLQKNLKVTGSATSRIPTIVSKTKHFHYDLDLFPLRNDNITIKLLINYQIIKLTLGYQP